MTYVANFWWLWLLFAVIGFGGAVYIQIGNFKRVQNMDIDGFRQRMGWMAALGLLGTGSGVILIVSIILNIISYAKQ
jgi:hypothetical protein